MKKYLRVLLGFLLLFSFYQAVYAQSDMEILRKRFQAELLEPGVDQVRIEKWIKTISDDGSWPGINYKDLSRTGFQNAEHLQRLVDLCRAYEKPGSTFKGNEKLKKAIDLALNYWLAHDFICDNWWWNQLGTPDALVKVLLIMDDDLTRRQAAETSSIVARATLDHIPGKFFGARESGDRVKIAGILAKRLLFQRDSLQFDRVIRIIEQEVKFTSGRGLQYDCSFHHRDDRVNNTLTYGRQFADVLIKWAADVAGTRFRFSDTVLHALVDYYLDGICKMLAYGKYPDPGAENREITRQGSLKAYSPVIPEKLLEATDYRKDELKKIVKIREGKARPALSYCRLFWQSDYFICQRPDFFTSVRMYSDRNRSMEEPYNGEGLMNHYRGDGTNYISGTGKEYDHLPPVYDWQKIPGATIMQRAKIPPPDEIQQKGLTDFVGAATDGRYGVVGFDFKSPLDPLKARKAWFFFDRQYVCLGTGISGDSPLQVVTTLNQCRLHGKVVVEGKDERRVLEKGMHQLEGIKWIWHDSIGYLFPQPMRVNLSNQAQTGSWYKVNHQEGSPKEKISEDVFKLWINHGPHPEGAAYQYIVVPAITAQRMTRKAEKSPVLVLSNSPALQAVRNNRLHIFEAVFYTSGAIDIANSLTLTMHDPGIIMVKTNGRSIKEITVEDPTHTLTGIHFSVSAMLKMRGNHSEVTWDKNNKTSNISIQLPQGVYAGKSVTVRF
jgi:chondroitin AC lyase